VERAPTVLPVPRNRLRRDRAEGGPEALLAARVRVGSELDPVVRVTLFETFREELEHQRPGSLGPLLWNNGSDASERLQRNALFSFSKNPSPRR
jgi:hypothetical protein